VNIVEYYETVNSVMLRTPGYRIGQAHYEVALANFPQLANYIVNTNLDPYYATSEKDISPLFFVMLAEACEPCTA
jgi:hypothetical protein